MSYGVGLRNGVAFALGTIPSLTSGGALRPSLLLDFLSGSLDPRITFSRGTQAMQYGSDGTLQYAPNNLLTYSNQADNAAWTKSNSFVQTNLLTFSDSAVANYVSISPTVVNTTPISGFTNSVRFPDNTSTIVAYKSYTVTINTPYTISAYVQMDDGAAPVLSFSSLTGDLTLVVDNNPAPLNLTTTSVGGGVYRISATYTTATFTGVNVGVVKYNTQSARGFKVTGLQLVQGSVPGDYRATTSAALPVLYADYNGALRARKLCEAATNATHSISQFVTTLAAPYTFSVYAKQPSDGAARRYFLVYHSQSNSGWVFDLQTGTLGVGGTTGVSAPVAYSITNIGSGWYRCQITVNATAVSNSFFYYTVDNNGSSGSVYTGDGSSGIYIADAQLTPGYLPLAVTETTSAAVYGPRFDYDPVTKVARGLLIEEQRVNLLLQSNDFQTSWTPTNITRTLNSTLSPEGVVNGVKIEATTGAATTLFQAAIVSATSATGSVYVKQGTSATVANTFILRNFTTATNLIGGTLNYNTGVFTYTIGSTGVVITNVGNGWWRVAITATAGITAGDSVGIYPGWGGGVATAGDFLYAYGAQLEAGAFATSYIPTVASTATRNADSASITTLTPWFNAAAGTVYSQFDVLATTVAAAMAVVSLDNGAANGYILYKGASSANLIGIIGANSSTLGAITANTPAKAVVAYDGVSNGGTLNGAAVTAITVAAVSTPNTLRIGSFWGGSQTSGHIQSIRYYPTRLPNASLQSITV